MDSTVEAATHMARETKVGLVTGLAFIVCFAFILANRGKQQPPTVHQPYVVDPGIDTRQVAGTLRRAHRPDAASAHPAVASTNSKTSIKQRRVPPVPIPTRNESFAQRTDYSGRLVENVSARLNQSGQHTPSTTTRLDAESRRQRLQQLVDGTVANQAHQNMPNGSQPSTESIRQQKRTPQRAGAPKKGVKIIARHRIVPGDTLSGIAKRQYGVQSAAAIDAIFQANRAVLSSPDALRVGVELVLPAIEGLKVATSIQPRNKVVHSTSKPAPSGTNSRFYQVRKNDRYVSIAREQLGDAGRWREIYELNKEKFPNAGRIREGVRIKLPAIRIAGKTRP